MNLHSNMAGRWRIVCTWLVNMIILQKPQSYRITQCLFSRIMLHIDQEEKLQSNQPSYANFLPVHWMVKYDFGVADHQGPPKKPLGQKNTCAKRRAYILMIWGKLLSSICLFRKVNEYVCKIQYINRSFLCNQHAQYFRGDNPSCIQPNKECLLLNASLLLRSFRFW